MKSRYWKCVVCGDFVHMVGDIKLPSNGFTCKCGKQIPELHFPTMLAILKEITEEHNK